MKKRRMTAMEAFLLLLEPHRLSAEADLQLVEADHLLEEEALGLEGVDLHSVEEESPEEAGHLWEDQGLPPQERLHLCLLLKRRNRAPVLRAQAAKARRKKSQFMRSLHMKKRKTVMVLLLP